MADPIETDPTLYHVVFENDRVRVLEYHDVPGDRTHAHHHPDSVLITLAPFRRRLQSGGRELEAEFEPHQVRWLGAQEHVGENIGETPTHVLFVELKDAPAGGESGGLGPD